MMQNPLISIITVVYNGEKHIESALRSIASQESANFEYIVIDGSSTDKTLDIVNKYSEYIDILISEPDKGIYDAMNKGVLKSTGDYIYFLNGDDYLSDPSVISDTIKFIKENPTDIILGFIDVVFKSPNFIKTQKIEYSKNNLKRGIQPPHSGSFFKKEVIVNLGFFDTNYKSAADFDLFCKAFVNNYSYSKFNRKFAVFNDGGFSSESNIGRFEGARIIKKHFGYFWYFKFYTFESIKLPFKNLSKTLGMYPYLLKFYKQNIN